MRVGLDIGSTTIKCVVLNDAGQIVYSTYERHFSHILEKGRPYRRFSRFHRRRYENSDFCCSVPFCDHSV